MALDSKGLFELLNNRGGMDENLYRQLMNENLGQQIYDGGAGTSAGKTYYQRMLNMIENPYDPATNIDQYAKFSQDQQFYGQNGYNDQAKKMFEEYGARKGWNTPQAKSSDVSAQPAQEASVKMDQGPFAGLRSLNAQIKYDAQGRPIRNDYLSVTDSNGNLLDQFQMSKKIGADVNMNTQGLDEIRNRALSIGPSAWAQLAMQKQQQEEAQGINKANRQTQAAQNSAFSMLAGRGGLSAGQKERLAMQGQRQAFAGGQQARNTGLMNRLDIQMQDQKQKDAFLSQLPSQDLAKANFDQSQRAYRDSYLNQDNSLALKDIGGYNAYNSGAYDAAMKEWGTAKTADAQARASSGGGKK